LKPGPKANTGDAAAAKTKRAASENPEGRSLVTRQDAAATHVGDVGRVKTKSSAAAKREQSAPMLSGWFAGTRASGAMYENSPP
jgi:hypothetical protein